MKRNLRITLIVFALLAALIYIFYDAIIMHQTADWDFIQRVGGIKTQTPLETQDGFYLPVICNVSGTDSITVKPTQINSALSCTKIKVDITENKIYLTVLIGVSNSNNINCNCKAVNIGHLKHGSYKVYYRDKSSSEHQIGQFDLSETVFFN
ncbi:MAG: hypothetical protein ABJB05_10645 [Parafilimonas sp.]